MSGPSCGTEDGASSVVGTRIAIAVVIVTLKISQGVALVNLLRRAALVLLDSADFPSAHDFSQGSPLVQVFLPAPKGQIVTVTEDQIAGVVVKADGLLVQRVKAVLVEAREFRGFRARVGQGFGPRVGNQEIQTAGEPLVDFYLEGIIGGSSRRFVKPLYTR